MQIFRNILKLIIVIFFFSLNMLFALSVEDTPIRSLSKGDGERKLEGNNITGAPAFGFDPDLGYLFGAIAIYTINGKKDDPYFNYAPYQHRIFAFGAVSTRLFQAYAIIYDAPYFRASKYRLRGSLNYTRNFFENYYGQDSSTLNGLDAPNGQRYNKFDSYSKDLRRVSTSNRTDSNYNNYDLERKLATFSVEKDLFRGYLRPIAGFSLQHIGIRDKTGIKVNATNPATNDISDTVGAIQNVTRLYKENQTKAITGYNGGWNNSLKLGFSIDTRDFEPDPNKGIFIESVAQISSRSIGSDFNYARVTVTPKFYYSPFDNDAAWYKDVVFAFRTSYSQSFGDVPFFEKGTLSFTDKNVDALGGRDTIRGYKKRRFVGNIMVLNNLETRWTFLRWKGDTDDFSLGIVFFYDFGRPFNNTSEIIASGFKSGYGAGIRFAWNQATIFSLDVGFSEEDVNQYFVINHQF